MSRIERFATPAAAVVGAHAVSQEDVGHVDGPVGRNDGFARRAKLRVPKAKHESNKKGNSGELVGDDDSTDEEVNDDEEQSDSSDKDDTNGDDDDEPELFDSPDTANVGYQTGHVPQPRSSLKRKRTTSELTGSIILDTVESADEHSGYPRKRISRRLSNGDVGSFQCDATGSDLDDDIDVTEYAKAIEESTDEEDTAELDQIDEENDSEVEQAEEEMIIQEETARLAHRDPLSAFGLDADADSDVDLPSDVDLGFLKSEMDDVFDNAETFFNRGYDSDVETPARKKSDASTRRVRFQDEIDVQHAHSSRSSSETDLDIFPDLLDNPFKAPEDLPANLRSQLEDEDDLDVGAGASSDGEGSVWDFGEGEASNNLFAWHDGAESDSDGELSGSDLSGYHSDGDTTDDDMPPPSTIRAPKTLLHSRSLSTITSSITTPKAFPRNKQARRGPVMGSFIVDEKKAMAFIDPNTRQLRIQPARNSFGDPFNSTASSANTSPQMRFNSLIYDSDNSDLPRLMTGPSDVMMSGVFGGLPGQRYEDGRFVMEANEPLLIGPPEAFYAFTSIRADGTPDEDDEYGTDTEFDADTDVFTMFMELENVEDEDEDGDDTGFVEDDRSSPTSDGTELVALSTKSSNVLGHLDRGNVNAFRKNQELHNHKARLPYHKSGSTPIRNGKSAEEFMTPLRKRKGGGVRKSKAPARRMPMMGSFA